MAEFVIGPLISMVMEKASSYLLDQYRVMKGMEEQRKILERQLPAILDIIQDAEKGASLPGVREWLHNLKTISYEANDVFDEFKYEALQREAKKKGHHRIKALATFPYRNPIVFQYRMGRKLLKIVQNIEVLVTEMNKFGFKNLQQAPPLKQWRMSDSVMVDSDKDFISRSRGKEKEKIMNILIHEASNKDLTVLPIVGMGGLGKTTFVQLIYNDPAIQNHFELLRWCCVSDDFDVANIASSLCQTNANYSKDREKILQDLQSMLSGKRYLIVLDDVWEPDEDKWGKVKTCLKHGAKGSVVLTTTRNVEIARRMATGIDEAYNIEKLSDEHLKEIVESRAFSLHKPNHSELDEIVDKIVDRCAGSPLAAKAFGSMLSTKTSANEWKNILTTTNICTERTGILPILKLSFDDLPSHMKQCFAFCAIFPKDYDIDVELLIQFWMAHDFLPVEDGAPETTGDEIFKELTWRSFFQDVKQTSPIRYGERTCQYRKKTICKIHDLMHDTALFVMGKECVTMVDNSSMKKLLSNPTRHLYLPEYGATLLGDYLKKQYPTLQTLFYTGDSSFDISKFTSLRALHLPSDPFLPRRWMHLPEQIHHLRYLNLSENDELEQLPEEISIMYHLQTLNISNCPKLRQLPKDMKYMASLRHLYTNGCKSLACMPPGLRQITSLQKLTYFVAGEASSGCSTLEELGNLNLGGEIELSCLENATEAHAKEVGLENKEELTHLSLEWNDKGQAEQVQGCHKKVLSALKPHDGLQMIRIVNYKGASLPTWIPYLSNLTMLYLLGCVMCQEFPQFCHLKALQVLCLEKLDKLRSLFSDLASTTFLALKKLQLHDLQSLEGWVTIEEKEVMFPVLERLDIKNCPKLTTLPEGPNLKYANLDEDKALLCLALVTKSMSSLSTLELSIYDTEETTPPETYQNHESSSLSKLKLQGCHFFFSSSNPSQPTFGAWKWFGKLVSLEISDCDALIYWPEDVFQSLVLLKNLKIKSCNKLIGCTLVRDGEPTQTADQVLPHLNKIDIMKCESLEELFILPSSLKIIFIYGCPRLEFVWGKEEHREADIVQPEYYRDLASTSIPEQSPSPMNRPPCLESLMIMCCDNLAILPNLPPSLKFLSIRNCDKLCSVSGYLDALEELFIMSCSKLQSFDSMGDLPSLEILILGRCQCLASLPGVLGNYSTLRELMVVCCPAIDLKPLYKRHQQRLHSLQIKDISHAHSSAPFEGPKPREPRSWKDAIPGVSYWTKRHPKLSMEAAPKP